jgi:hypothetical protein
MPAPCRRRGFHRSSAMGVSRTPTRSRSSNKAGFRSSSRTTIRANRIAAARTWLSFAVARFASSDAATVHALAGIGRTPDVLATSASVFKLDVQSADDALAAHKADNAATDATGIRHGGETRALASPPERI